MKNGDLFRHPVQCVDARCSLKTKKPSELPGFPLEAYRILLLVLLAWLVALLATLTGVLRLLAWFLGVIALLSALAARFSTLALLAALVLVRTCHIGTPLVICRT
jgi:hypothetical protein